MLPRMLSRVEMSSVVTPGSRFSVRKTSSPICGVASMSSRLTRTPLVPGLSSRMPKLPGAITISSRGMGARTSATRTLPVPSAPTTADSVRAS